MSFAALALCARAANDTTRAQINNIPEKSHVIPLFTFVSSLIDETKVNCFKLGVKLLLLHRLIQTEATLGELIREEIVQTMLPNNIQEKITQF